MKRRTFIRGGLTSVLLARFRPLASLLDDKPKWIAVQGEISHQPGVTLIHEHILVDFIGAGQSGPHRYDSGEVVSKALPFLMELKDRGCRSFVDCTPAYLGRDVSILHLLSEDSGLNILTNTGYYGAVDGKYLPDHAFEESAGQLATRWIREWEEGIDGLDIRPGFIKIGVNKGPLSEIDRKLVEAASITHLQTGLTISSHTGNGLAALEQIEILTQNGVSPDAFRWVHAQNEKDVQIHLEAAQKGAWVEFDGISENSAMEHLAFIRNMKENDFLHKCLISQDSGWYHAGETNGGTFNPYTYIFDQFLPLLKSNGFNQVDIDLLLVENPANSLEIYPRKMH